MKNLKKTLLIFFLTSFLLINGQSKKTSFLVNGVCEMCEKRIENALDIKGVNFASWDMKTKMCNVTFNSSKIKFTNLNLKNIKLDLNIYKKKFRKSLY